ncbi:MAG: MFS transporter [Elusimicrobia bacterium]|nr:MFS transporter [Elusimicrobiota bacterium]
MILERLSSWKQGLSRNVVLLGVVSGLTDISSEMLYPILPLFLTGVLNAPMSVVGLIEGVAEATASLLKAGGGWWSDHTRRRKPFAVWGYGISSLSKPLLALASTWHLVFLARFLDRTGKGIRSSARDALIADSTDRAHWGKAFGFHRAMDTLGAAVGPLVALYLLEGRRLSYQSVFIIAFIPAVLGVLVLSLLVQELRPLDAPALPDGVQGARPPALTAPPALSSEFKRFLGSYAVFCLGNSSDVFILLKAKDSGFSTTSIILAYVGYNIVYALAAMPAGWLSDHIGRRKTLACGLLIFSGVYLGFGLASSLSALWLLFAAYGLYAAFTENVAKAMVADLSVSSNRGTAMGVFQGSTGVLAFAASGMAGLLWTHVSPSAPFILAACCGLASCVLVLAMPSGKQEPSCPA